MFIVDCRGILPQTSNIYLWPDMHEGFAGTADKKVGRAVAIVRADKHARVIGMGDACESCFIGHPYYKKAIHAGRADTADLQCESVAKKLAPIGQKFLAWLDGNHEERYTETTDMSMNIVSDLSGRSNRKELIPYGGRTAKILLTDQAKIYVTHGSGVVNSRAGDPEQRRVNDGISIRRKLRDLPRHDCVVTAMAHIHKVRISPPQTKLAVVGERKLRQTHTSFMRNDDGYIPDEFCWYCSTGGVLAGYPAKTWEPMPADADKEDISKRRSLTTYVEKANYSVVEMGMICIEIRKGVVINVKEITL